jgi:hypothetical protein
VELLGEISRDNRIKAGPRVPERRNLRVRAYGDVAILTGDLLNHLIFPTGCGALSMRSSLRSAAGGPTGNGVSCRFISRPSGRFDDRRAGESTNSRSQQWTNR